MPRAHTRPIALAVSAGLVFGFSAVAIAQSSVDQADSKPPASGSRTIAKAAPLSRIEHYAKVLNLDATQTLAAKQLYEASEAQLAAAGKKMNEAMKDAQEDMNDGDSATFEKKMQKANAEHTAATTQITGSFLSDLKSLLTSGQADRWPTFERYRRRERYLGALIGIGSMGVSGSNVDLIRLVEKLAIPAEIKAKVDEQLGMYEADMDHPLREREQNMESEQKQMGAVQHFDAEEFAKKQERDRKVDLAIRDLNSKYVRQIAAILPDDLAKQLTESYQARAFRPIYRESSIAKKVANSQKLGDLTADQRSKLQSLLDKYRSDARAANDKWAAAQSAAETAGRPTGGGFLMLGPGDGGGDKVDPDFAAARDARRDLDKSARDQLEKILTPDQLAAIPQPPPALVGATQIAVMGNLAGDNVMVLDDIDLGDDADGPGTGSATMIIRTVTSAPIEIGSQEDAKVVAPASSPAPSQPDTKPKK